MFNGCRNRTQTSQLQADSTDHKTITTKASSRCGLMQNSNRLDPSRWRCRIIHRCRIISRLSGAGRGGGGGAAKDIDWPGHKKAIKPDGCIESSGATASDPNRRKTNDSGKWGPDRIHHTWLHLQTPTSLYKLISGKEVGVSNEEI